jgi:hypothetical protein
VLHSGIGDPLPALKAEALEPRQAVETHEPLVSDLGPVQIELGQPRELDDMFHGRVADPGVGEIELAQLGEAGEILEAAARDLDVRQPEPPQACQPAELAQACIRDARVAELEADESRERPDSGHALVVELLAGTQVQRAQPPAGRERREPRSGDLRAAEPEVRQALEARDPFQSRVRDLRVRKIERGKVRKILERPKGGILRHGAGEVEAHEPVESAQRGKPRSADPDVAHGEVSEAPERREAREAGVRDPVGLPKPEVHETR